MMPLQDLFFIFSLYLFILSCNGNDSGHILTDQYHVENLCSHKDHDADIMINKWNVAIVKFGKTGILTNRSRSIQECEIKLKTDKKFRLTAAIEYMRIRGRRDRNNKWHCEDYIEFTSIPSNTVGKFFFEIKLDFFNGRKSEELCGTKNLDGIHNNVRITDMSTDANSFSSSSNEMILRIKQNPSDGMTYNNSFEIVFTSFHHEKDEVGCAEMHKCQGYNNYCIEPLLVCDGHINCAFPGIGSDEKGCFSEEPRSTMNITTIIVATLGCITLIATIFVFITVLCRFRRKRGNRRSAAQRNFASSASEPSAPNLDRGGSLPRYETVIVSELEQKDEASDFENDHLPPKYESLFPDGASESHSPRGNS